MHVQNILLIKRYFIYNSMYPLFVCCLLIIQVNDIYQKCTQKSRNTQNDVYSIRAVVKSSLVILFSTTLRDPR